MQDKIENKAMGSPATKGQTTPASQAAPLREYFYPGEGKYKPKTVKARDQKEADEIWEREREQA